MSSPHEHGIERTGRIRDELTYLTEASTVCDVKRNDGGDPAKNRGGRGVLTRGPGPLQ